MVLFCAKTLFDTFGVKDVGGILGVKGKYVWYMLGYYVGML